jgi:hypothetical protein
VDNPMDDDLIFKVDNPMDDDLILKVDNPINDDLILKVDNPMDDDLILKADNPINDDLILKVDNPMDDDLIFKVDNPMDDDLILKVDNPMDDDLIFKVDKLISELGNTKQYYFYAKILKIRDVKYRDIALKKMKEISKNAGTKMFDRFVKRFSIIKTPQDILDLNFKPDVKTADKFIKHKNNQRLSWDELMYHIADWNVLGNCAIQTKILKRIKKSHGSNAQIFSFLNKLKNNDIKLSQELLNKVTLHFSMRNYKLAFSFINSFDTVIYNKTIYAILDRLGRDGLWRRDLELTSKIWGIISNRLSYANLKRINEACARTGDIGTLLSVARLLKTKNGNNVSRMYLSLLRACSSENLYDPELAVQVWLSSPQNVKENPESVQHLINSVHNRESFKHYFPMICVTVLKCGGLAVDNFAELVRVGIRFENECNEFQNVVFEACANYLKVLNVAIMDGSDVIKSVDELGSENCLRLFDHCFDNGLLKSTKIDDLKCVGQVVKQYYEDMPKDEVLENAITELERIINE